MNDIIFANSFNFNYFSFDSYHYTDNQKGIGAHYFAYMEEGRCKIVTKDYYVEINKGDVFYIPNKQGYRSYWYGTPKIKFVSLGFEFLPNVDSKSYPVQVVECDKENIKIFDELKDVRKLSPKDIGRFYFLVGHLMENMKSIKVNKSIKLVEKINNYLYKNPKATIYEISEKFDISPSGIYFAFRKSSNTTLNSMRKEIILEKAKDMIVSTDKKISQISDDLGFSSYSYFRKEFEKKYKIAPLKMRKNMTI